MRINKKTVFAIAIVTAVLLSGCKAEEIQTRVQPAARKVENTEDVGSEIKKQEESNSHAEQRAIAISAEIEKFDEVEDASVVVTGNTAIIGIRLFNELNDSDLVGLKRKIEKEAKAVDSGIDHVAVSSAPDLVDKITGMSGEEDAETKKELKENEGKNIFFRLIPTI